MKKIIYSLIFCVFWGQYAKADEGMWLLSMINKNFDQLKAAGFKLTSEDIYNLNNACLKDAVIRINDGTCTGEIISDQGLMITNHRCAYEYIQNHSSKLNDYLANGFWAETHEQEIANTDLKVSFMIDIEEVTGMLYTESDSVFGNDRSSVIKERISELKNRASEDGKYDVSVVSFFNGNNYYMIRYLSYNDVRLVGAPPESIGCFGFESDAFSWPRHTADFALFRIYTAPDGSPAGYSPENIPLKPKYSLTVSENGYKEGDFTMTLGYPFQTSRYISSWELQRQIDITDKVLISILNLKLDIYKSFMNKDKTIAFQYSSKYADNVNAYQVSLGESLRFARLNVLERKQELEKELKKWIDKNQQRKQTYSSLFDQMSDYYRNDTENWKNLLYFDRTIIDGPEIIAFCNLHSQLEQAVASKNKKDISSVILQLKSSINEFWSNYNVDLDKQLAKTLFTYFSQNINQQYYPQGFPTNGNIDAFVDKLFAKSIFTDRQKYEAFIKKPDIEVFKSDICYLFAKRCYKIFNDVWRYHYVNDDKVKDCQRLYMKAFMEYSAEKYDNNLIYPDANGTMRLSYGKVERYSYEGQNFNYYTDLESLLAKEDTSNYEYYIPEKLKGLHADKDFGRWNVDGTIPVCFITDNDITSGNSGSPVLNAEGQLIGLVFDTNNEAKSYNFVFEKESQRTVCVDIRYILFIIEKYAGARNIIDELKITE